MKDSKAEEQSDVSLSFLAPGIESRIDELCRRIGGREQAAMAAGVSAVMLRRYIKGESKPPFEVIANLAGRANVSLDWVAFGDKPRVADALGPEVVPQDDVLSDTLGNAVDISEFVFIPRYGVKAAAGHGQSITDEAPTHTMAFRRYWVENYLHAKPADLSVLSVRGDSQQGVLNDRDVILIDRSQTSGSAGLYVLRIDGEIIVKTLQRLPGGILEVSSANPAYKPFEVNAAQPPDDFAIIGRVVWFGRQV
ncbi:helix-turn-helix transcriptional regulator [Burkholderia pseudomultivorans]|uniref:XRE family transcriptional regulator n=1 Tax=Burkholderia pseudomultivorans TaxID=1207504 RepID=UPI0028767673|nr:helix-turn-helix transcriptional regulator [Burkholderia pseudomultivorans]MDS0794664.1 helix-turn-helix transcriptional regulator [Burkholderia pseudomultivorans]